MLLTSNSSSESHIASLIAAFAPDPDWQRDLYRKLHANPELSGKEIETARMIARELGRFNAEVTTNIGGNGMVAVFRNGPGPTVLMRADFDGLPVKEESGLEWASHKIDYSGQTPTPVMHACGHDMHTTALLGACQVLDSAREHWSGTFIALFQPSEENGAGAARMVADGLAEAIPKPDVCFGQHVIAGPAGQVSSMPGAALASCDSIEIVLTGQSAHGSMPHNAIDPTFLAAMIVIRLQGIVGREIPPHEFAVVSVGTLESGNSNNTIPGQARIVLNCRTYNEEIKAQLYAAIERVVRGECKASGTTVDPTFRYFAHGPLTDNTPEVFRRVRATFDQVFGPDSTDATRWTASEDFANLPEAFGAPYLFWTVGVTPREQWDKALAEGNVAETIPVNHMGTFVPDYEPTVHATTSAAVAAVLTYLRK
ncbi:amidohydrolase [Corynebacterium kozikiae]|uniref:amidohydrolase n=1 Tax=Corynebacterium kozikiae TaxID=2968469 RepID=UPI00359C3DA3